jgi:hypothetical protein
VRLIDDETAVARRHNSPTPKATHLHTVEVKLYTCTGLFPILATPTVRAVQGAGRGWGMVRFTDHTTGG